MGEYLPNVALSISFRIIIFLILVVFPSNAIATDTLTQSESLAVGQTLISLDQVFELGFFNPGNSSKRYVGIWYKKISWHKPVWVANRESPLGIGDNAAVLTIGNDGNLLILNGTKSIMWSTNISSKANGTSVFLAKNGALILKDNTTGLNLWESFEKPCDTLIAGMEIGIDQTGGKRLVLSSWKTEDDPSPGDYVMGFTTERPPQKFVWKNSKPYWRSGPWNGWKFVGLEGPYGGYTDGYVVTQDIKQGSVYYSNNPPDSSEIYIEQLKPQGSLQVLLYDTEQPGTTRTRFGDLVSCDGYASCGPFGVCYRSKATCKCLKGFVPKSLEEWKNGKWKRGCVRQTELLCNRNTSSATSIKEKVDGFIKVNTVKMPDRHMYLETDDASACRQQCLKNCSCMAYSYVNGIGCLTWSGDLLDIKRFSTDGVELFVRLAYSELNENNKRTKLIVILTTSFGCIFIGIILYNCYKCIARQRVARRRQTKEITSLNSKSRSQHDDMDKEHITPNESNDLPMYSFDIILTATNNFSEENKLGAGGFGPVYKGKLKDGEEVAIKRLSTHSGQGTVEFKNEILLISKLQHRNLVKLLGYCVKDDEKLLIYEYLKNKSLDTILFDKKNEEQLYWDKRFEIIQGIARGLLYLHRDSHLRIIHRDLKASNILLDDKMNPKISDFGLARGFQITQELGNTCRVVGTLGYISPEYAIGGLFSEKSDVFSFGVLLLEIISGKKNSSLHYQENYMNLLGYVWHLWEEGNGIALMDSRLHGSCPAENFIKCMQIGLLCIQDHAIDRPTMSLVVLMLTSDIPIPQPKKPVLYRGLLNSSFLSESADHMSKNIVSVSMIEGR